MGFLPHWLTFRVTHSLPTRLLLCLLLLCLPGTALAQFPSGGRGSGAGAEADTTGLPALDYNADRIEYIFADTTMALIGSAELTYGDVELTAGRLLFNTSSNLLTADFLPPAPDIDPETNTYPRLQDETNVVVGDRMQYDMNTGEGQIWKGRTQYDQGFFDGDLITLNADRTFEIHNGSYTTCDNPNHLHYYLKMGEAKVAPDDKAVVRNMTGYILGIPVIYLPVYVFSVKQGRQSGFTVPNYGSGVEEGRYLRNLGYYWAPNEYFDMKTTADIEANTGFLLRQQFQYRQDRRLRGSVQGSWRRGFEGTTSGWDVNARHRQEVIPGLTIRGQGNFAQSLRYLHSTTRGTDPGQLRSTTRSTFAIDKKFGRNSLNLSTSTSSTTGRPSRPNTTLRFRFGTKAIFKPPRRQTRRGSMPDFSRPRTEIEKRWFHSIMFGFNNTLRNRRKNIRGDRDTDHPGPDIRYHYTHAALRTFANAFNLSAPQKLGDWLKIRPQARYTRTWEQDTDPEEEGNWEQKEDHTVGMSVNTTLYGLFQPKIGRLNAIRHVVTPDINFSQSGGKGGSRVRKTMRFSLNNILQARTEHEGREKKYNLVYVKSSTSYDFQAEDEKFADLRTTVRIPSRRFNVNLSMNHDFYDPETKAFGRPRLDRMTLSTSLNLVGPRRDQDDEFGDNQFGGAYGGYDDYSGGSFGGSSFGGSSFSGGGFGSSGLGDSYGGYGGYGDDRFNQRFAQVKGPWTVRLSHRYSIRRNVPDPDSDSEDRFTTSAHEVRATNRFALNEFSALLRPFNRFTDKWRVQHSINYDYKRKKIVSHSLDLYRPLHCWEFTFRWVPNGINKGFYFRINLIAHPDVKLEQQRRSGGGDEQSNFF
ncbi:MAG: LPS-assembly protein LptD [Gemmatimonadetes bacterium]|nr:LPS-assembly protein LptD [Gemmatimonadota bacterium]MYB61848.1 LPS-assembly protein LptD [Gemmatimonadota bacterium]